MGKIFERVMSRKAKTDLREKIRELKDEFDALQKERMENASLSSYHFSFSQTSRMVQIIEEIQDLKSQII